MYTIAVNKVVPEKPNIHVSIREERLTSIQNEWRKNVHDMVYEILSYRQIQKDRNLK